MYLWTFLLGTQNQSISNIINTLRSLPNEKVDSLNEMIKYFINNKHI